MTTPEKYDLLVIGAGPAGSAAIEVAIKQRAKIALVEQDKLGGTCLTYGCDPTKLIYEGPDRFEH
jgi:pyruvate/2-oxoglutarate dehydrogenase complex dihydrolipoamide dehydrogenase (E3) component